MRIKEDECVACGLPCLGVHCPNRNVEHLYCDKCGEPVDTLYECDEEELCEKCAADFLEREEEENE